MNIPKCLIPKIKNAIILIVFLINLRNLGNAKREFFVLEVIHFGILHCLYAWRSRLRVFGIVVSRIYTLVYALNRRIVLAPVVSDRSPKQLVFATAMDCWGCNYYYLRVFSRYCCQSLFRLGCLGLFQSIIESVWTNLPTFSVYFGWSSAFPCPLFAENCIPSSIYIQCKLSGQR